jgi:aspartyl protease family protein
MKHVGRIISRTIPGILLIVSVFILLTQSIQAAQSVEVQVQALFTGKAVLMIDGQRRVLGVGETSPEGVKLLKSDSNGATLEIDGVSKDYILDSSTSYSFKKQESVEEQLFSNERGMFLTIGTINGQTVRFLVDTGATTIAMNTTQAKKLGVRYRIEGEKTRISTASSFVNGYSVKLKSVSVGKIKLKNVEAMVIDGKHPGPILLGMSFLNKLKVEKVGNMMKIMQRK